MATVQAVNRAGTLGLVPDLTILMDMPPGGGLSRKHGEKRDRFETETIKFHERVRRGYLELAEKEPERWFVIEAEKSKDEITEIIWQKVNRLINIKR